MPGALRVREQLKTQSDDPSVRVAIAKLAVASRRVDQNALMTEVSIYTAAIAGAAAIGGAAVPSITSMMREVGQAKRERRDRAAAEKRQACLDLLGAAQKLRIKVANAANYHGPEMGSRLEEIRECEADVRLHAASASLQLTAESLRLLADNLADVASDLTALAERNTNMKAGQIDPRPDTAGFNASIEAFRSAIVAERRK